ncbi:MAG: tRNA pseudouridine(38-40) synthase TruA [Dehalococcoidia bacterium]
MTSAGRRIALVVEYEGTHYGGSQLQKNAPSIQAALESALAKLTREQTRVAFAGRTDAGVHAIGQVAAFNTSSELGTEVFVRGLNAWLPDDVAVRRAVEVDSTFDPRRHASSRTYRYTIANVPVRSPLWRKRAWQVAEPLDENTMQRAATALAGEHDFAAFSRREGVRTVRCVRRCDVRRRGALVTVEIEANAFLRQQVRRTVGALVQVGLGKLSLRALNALLKRAEPNTAGPVAPAHGLCLMAVTYPGLDLTDTNALS